MKITLKKTTVILIFLEIIKHFKSAKRLMLKLFVIIYLFYLILASILSNLSTILTEASLSTLFVPIHVS
jgi:hypothetical protein